MRISSKQFFEGLSDQVGRNQSRLGRLQMQAASGSQVQEASDNPTGVAKALGLQSVLSELEQFGRNAVIAKQTLGATDTALGRMSDTLRDVKSLVIRVGNQPVAEQERDTLAGQIDQLTDALVAALNSRDGDAPLFAGTSATQTPFGRAPEGSPAFTYKGDSGQRIVQVGPSARIATNVPGDQLFSTPETDIITQLQALKEQLSTKGATVDVDAALRVTDAAAANVLKVRQSVGGRMQLLDSETSQLDVAKENAQSTISSIMDADLAQTVVDLKTAETVYEASIATTARISQQSLLDYIKQ